MILTYQDAQQLIVLCASVALFGYILYRILTFVPSFIRSFIKRAKRGGLDRARS